MRPVVAVENCSGSFPRSGGRVLFASTAPPASTGGLMDSPRRMLCDQQPVADRFGPGRPRGAMDDRHTVEAAAARPLAPGAPAVWPLAPSLTSPRPGWRVQSSASRGPDIESPADRRRPRTRARCCAPGGGGSAAQSATADCRSARPSRSRPCVSPRGGTPCPAACPAGRARGSRRPTPAPAQTVDCGRPILRVEKRIRRRNVDKAFPSQLLHESILMRSVVPLDPALGLWRTRRNNLDAQRCAHAPELRQRLGARLALLLIRAPHIDILPIRVESSGNPGSARSTLARPPPPPRSSPVPRAVRGSVPSHRRPASASSCAGRDFKPGMKAPIELDQLAEVRHALPPPSMRAPLAGPAPQARRQHPPPQRFVIRQPPHLHSPDARLPASDQTCSSTFPLYFSRIQRQGPGLQPGRRCPIRGATRAPMFQPFRPVGTIASIEPLRLAVAHVHQGRR